MARYLIRKAAESDAEGISHLLEQLGYELSAGSVVGRLRKYRETGGSVWVASEGTRVIGFLSFHTLQYFHAEGIGGRITAMCVDRENRRRGIGRALLNAMESVAEGLGCQRVEVTSGNHRKDEAHKFYEASGYAFWTGRFLKQIRNTERGSAGQPAACPESNDL